MRISRHPGKKGERNDVLVGGGGCVGRVGNGIKKSIRKRVDGGKNMGRPGKETRALLKSKGLDKRKRKRATVEKEVGESPLI